MSEDFHILWDAGTRWEDGVHYYLAPRQDRINALLPMLSSLIEYPTDPSGEHICPICQESLEVSIYYADLTQDPLTISLFCETCNIHDFFRSNKIPSWAKKWPDDFPEVKEFFANLGKDGDENA
jgi:hypothetical protein